MIRFFTLVFTVLFSSTLSLAQSSIPAGAVAINEFVADNDSLSGISDPDGGYPDWIELYNTTEDEIDLSNAYLSDKEDNRLKFQFPDGTRIAADGYLIVWADEDGDQQGIHANFKLSRSGEAIYLSNADESTIDGVEFGEQQTNVSLSRSPNGTGPFVVQAVTFNGNNDEPSSTRNGELSALLSAYPNPTTDVLRVELPTADTEYTVDVRSLNGQPVVPARQVRGASTEVAVRDLPAGMYLLFVRDEEGRNGVLRFHKR